MVYMQSLLDNIVGPLDKSYYCNFFLILTIFGFVFLIGAMIILIYNLYKETSVAMFMKSLFTVFFYGVFYLQSRILYSMCLGTIA